MTTCPLLIALSDSGRRPFFDSVARRLQKPARYVTGLMELMAVTTETYDKPALVLVDRALLGDDPSAAAAIYQTLCLQFDPAPVLLQACVQGPMVGGCETTTHNIMRCEECAHGSFEHGPARGCFPSLDQIEQVTIDTAIQACGGNIQAAATYLGIAPSTIYRRRQRGETRAGS